MLWSINYLCHASTDDVLSLLKLRGQTARVFQPLGHECSGLWISVLFTAILGISTAKGVAVPMPPAMQAHDVVVSIAPY